MPLEQFEFVARINLIGSFNRARPAASTMAATEPLGDGTSRDAIVNTASATAFDDLRQDPPG